MARSWLFAVILLLSLAGCSAARVEPTAHMNPPIKISGSGPVYPERLAEQRLEGSVIVEATVSRTGQVKQVRVLRSTDPRFEAPAIEAVKQWRFEPAMHRGQPVEVTYNLVVNFELPPEESSPANTDD